MLGTFSGSIQSYLLSCQCEKQSCFINTPCLFSLELCFLKQASCQIFKRFFFLLDTDTPAEKPLVICQNLKIQDAKTQTKQGTSLCPRLICYISIITGFIYLHKFRPRDTEGKYKGLRNFSAFITQNDSQCCSLWSQMSFFSSLVFGAGLFFFFCCFVPPPQDWGIGTILLRFQVSGLAESISQWTLVILDLMLMQGLLHWLRDHTTPAALLLRGGNREQS